MKSPSNLKQTGKKGTSNLTGLKDVGSSVGKARGSASLTNGKGLAPTGAGKGNKFGSANASMRKSGRGR